MCACNMVDNAAPAADDNKGDDDEEVVAEVVALTCGICRVNPS